MMWNCAVAERPSAAFSNVTSVVGKYIPLPDQMPVTSPAMSTTSARTAFGQIVVHALFCGKTEREDKKQLVTAMPSEPASGVSSSPPPYIKAGATSVRGPAPSSVAGQRKYTPEADAAESSENARPCSVSPNTILSPSQGGATAMAENVAATNAMSDNCPPPPGNRCFLHFQAPPPFKSMTLCYHIQIRVASGKSNETGPRI